MAETVSGRVASPPGWPASPEPSGLCPSGDHSSRGPTGTPMLVRGANGWHVLGEDGQKFELVPAPDNLAPDAEAPGNDELRFIGAFDRKTKVGRHQAENRHHLRATIEALDAAGFSDAADTLVWQVWHQVNSVARAREFHRLALEDAGSWRRVAERLEAEAQELLSVCDCEIRDQTNNRQTSDRRSAAYAEGALRVAKSIAHRIREKSEARR